MCTVQRGDTDRLWVFIERDFCPPEAVSRVFLGLMLDAEQNRLPRPQVEWEAVSSWEWPEEIRDFLKAREVGNRIVLLEPSEENPFEERIPVRLDGRYGFGGVGVHPTTGLCLEALERHLPDQSEVQQPVLADIGCGAGVLGIAAILLGARKVYAVDTKASSVSATRINCELNDIPADRLVVEKGSVSHLRTMLGERSVDGFVCNILAKIIYHLIPSFADNAHQDTWGVLSGIREHESERIEEQLKRNGWNTTEIVIERGWCSMEIERDIS